MSDAEIHPFRGHVDRTARWSALGVCGATLWLTGLSGSGKSTIAAGVERELVRRGVPAYRLDGDSMRTGLNRDLGFDDADRTENVRRLGEVARLLADAGLVAIVCAISPFGADRAQARAVHDNHPDGPLPFIEAHVDAPLAVCEARDPKGLYRRARAGELHGLTGVDAPYEAPSDPDLTLDTATTDADACVRRCVETILARRSTSASPCPGPATPTA